MKNQEREDCGLYPGMEFYMSGRETEWRCWSCLQDLLAPTGAAGARCPNKYIIHMTNSSFCLTLHLHPHTINIYGTVSGAIILFSSKWLILLIPMPELFHKEGAFHGKILQRAANRSENPWKTWWGDGMTHETPVFRSKMFSRGHAWVTGASMYGSKNILVMCVIVLICMCMYICKL